MRQKINLQDIQALTLREQERFQTWSYYHLQKYHPTPEEIRARQENDEDDDSRSTD